MSDLNTPNLNSPQKCKHGLYEWNCLNCAMTDVLMQKQLREWEEVFKLAQMANITLTKNRIRKEGV